MPRLSAASRTGALRRSRALSAQDLAFWRDLELTYRTLCAVMFNFVPNSGHPGGSISSGPILLALAFESLDYDPRRPGAPDADLLCLAAGHKALGLYALTALRTELSRIGNPRLLPEPEDRLTLEDLVGFRRNPTEPGRIFRGLRARALDGHPTPATPFVPLATGASGVGLAAAVGLALGAADAYGEQSPRVHIVEGEGGLTPGRVHEALSAASIAGLGNAVLHVDWNQSSIDSDRVCAEGGRPGDYVPWDPRSLLELHGWTVLETAAGADFRRVLGAQRLALGARAAQRPTAIVYRTVKGHRYGIEGRASHGAGHAYCSQGYRRAVAEFERRFGVELPAGGDSEPERVERDYYETLKAIRRGLESCPELAAEACRRLERARHRLKARERRPRDGGPNVEALFSAELRPDSPPPPLSYLPGRPAATRAALGDALGWLNARSGGALMGCAADLLGSTSVSALNAGFPPGFYHRARNPRTRLVAAGGICEDAMGGIMAGLSSFGAHVGLTSSYSAFIAPLEHVAARLHAIGQQARRERGAPARPWIMVNAHAGPMTGEDGPTHADVQGLQLLQGNFPPGALVTLTPWEAQEVWPLLSAALRARPAVIAPFVTRPAAPVPDRKALRLPPAAAAAEGVYALRRTGAQAAVILQGAAVATAFVAEVLPRLDAERVPIEVFYVASAELFDALPDARREAILPSALLFRSFGITDFTLPTMHRWVRSVEGLRATLHPFRKGGYLGSGSWQALLREGGLDGASQLEAVRAWAEAA